MAAQHSFAGPAPIRNAPAPRFLPKMYQHRRCPLFCTSTMFLVHAGCTSTMFLVHAGSLRQHSISHRSSQARQTASAQRWPRHRAYPVAPRQLCPPAHCSTAIHVDSVCPFAWPRRSSTPSIMDGRLARRHPIETRPGVEWVQRTSSRRTPQAPIPLDVTMHHCTRASLRSARCRRSCTSSSQLQISS